MNLAAFQTFRNAINSGKFADFENVITGGPRTQNGPLGGRAFALEGSDPAQFGNATSPANQINQIVVPPAPALASETYGTELVEMYWASLLRDIAFTDYASNATAVQAAAELSSMPTYLGPRDGSGNVTPDLLFRGTYPGDTFGPYLSQFHLQPTYLGTQPIDQQMVTSLPDIDYMTDATTYQQVQNGINTGASLQFDPQLRYLHDGRGLCAFTHVDVLFQAYFVAFLLLGTLGAPRNPGTRTWALRNKMVSGLSANRMLRPPQPPLACAEQRLVSEMVDSPEASSRVRRRDCPADFEPASVAQSTAT